MVCSRINHVVGLLVKNWLHIASETAAEEISVSSRGTDRECFGSPCPGVTDIVGLQYKG